MAKIPDSMENPEDPFAAIYVISVAAELAGMHPQTLRQYDRLGLVIPQRTSGRGRRYTFADVQTLREVQKLSQEEGINLAGIKRILNLRNRLAQVEAENRRLRELAYQAVRGQERMRRKQRAENLIFQAEESGEVSHTTRNVQVRADGTISQTTQTRRGKVGEEALVSQEIIRYVPGHEVVIWRE